MKFFKGSPEAFEWAERMQKKKEEKKKEVRAEGLKMEEEFFGKSGIVTQAAELKAAEKIVERERASAHLNPAEDVPQGVKLIKYMAQKGWKPVAGKYTPVFSRLSGVLFQILQKEARAWRLLQKTNLSNELLSAGTFPTLELALILADSEAGTYLKNPKKKSGKGVLVRDEQVSKSVAIQIYQTSANRFTVVIIDKSKQSLSLQRQIWGVYNSLEKANHAVDFWITSVWEPQKAERARYGIKDNPFITVVGNPVGKVQSGHIQARIEGVVYNRCVEIRAEKTAPGKLKGFYKHPFSKQSQVCILALDNGDLLIHSKTGEKLWGRS